MTSKQTDGSGLTNGRQWSVQPSDGAPIEWSIDTKQGYVQGPLDLEFMRGQKLSVCLEEGQQALLVQDGQLKAVYLDGVHYLDIGNGRSQVDPSCQLIFLALDEPLHLHWTRSRPLYWGTEAHQALIGRCALHIEWPNRFFTTFLQGHPNPDPGFISRLIDQMVCGLFANHLSGILDDLEKPTASELQAKLTRLTPEDLSEDLNACGLSCLHLAVYTSAPPIEEELIQESVADQTAGY